tara:strand:- start:2909 stop:3328 length:420 start_codon:yes stop_codon:yes gene_type:complete
MDGVILTPLKQIHHPKGDILHGMKKSDIGFDGFGEAYFSSIKEGEIKGWKKHRKMTLNLIVPVGEIEFVVFDAKKNNFFNVKISQNNYQRLTIKSGLWLAFRGLKKNNLLLNLSNVEHNPKETEDLNIPEINYNWKIKS